MEQNQTVRVRRIGSITTGLTFVAGGVMFILAGMFEMISYEMIFKLWPLILIGLGIEILWFNHKEKNLVYDKGAVFMLVMMSFFSMSMAVVEYIINNSDKLML